MPGNFKPGPASSSFPGARPCLHFALSSLAPDQPRSTALELKATGITEHRLSICIAVASPTTRPRSGRPRLIPPQPPPATPLRRFHLPLSTSASLHLLAEDFRVPLPLTMVRVVSLGPSWASSASNIKQPSATGQDWEKYNKKFADDEIEEKKITPLSDE